MQRTTLSAIFFGLLLYGIGGLLQASEVEELLEKAEAMRQEAHALAAKGNVAEAERIEREAANIDASVRAHFGRGNRSSLDMEHRRLEERRQDLIAEERAIREANAVKELIAASNRQLEIARSQLMKSGRLSTEFHEQTEKLEFASRRIHHLRVAAENLKQAEKHDLAHKLMEEAESMERDVRAAKERLAAGIEDRPKHVEEQQPGWVRKLREEIQQLRAEVRELRQKVEERGQADRRFTPPQPLEPSRSFGPAYEKK